MRVAGVRGLAATVLLLAASPALAVESEVVTASGAFGCHDLKNFDRAMTLAEENDMVAFNKFMSSMHISGGCMAFPPGTMLFLEDRSGEDRVCARPKGEVDCYWTVTKINIKD